MVSLSTMGKDTPIAIRLGSHLDEVDRIVQEQKKQGFPSNRCHVIRMLVGEALERRKRKKGVST
jgi:Arc/MetJ-type ribon-helix-helix transcriptional regulator